MLVVIWLNFTCGTWSVRRIWNLIISTVISGVRLLGQVPNPVSSEHADPAWVVAPVPFRSVPSAPRQLAWRRRRTRKGDASGGARTARAPSDWPGHLGLGRSITRGPRSTQNRILLVVVWNRFINRMVIVSDVLPFSQFARSPCRPAAAAQPRDPARRRSARGRWELCCAPIPSWVAAGLGMSTSEQSAEISSRLHFLKPRFFCLLRTYLVKTYSLGPQLTSHPTINFTSEVQKKSPNKRSWWHPKLPGLPVAATCTTCK